MTNVWRRGLVADALRAFGLSRHQSADGPHEPPTLLSDEEAMAQVVEAARQIVGSARLEDVTGAFRFESCNDQGEPPYRGRVDMSFVMSDGVEPDGFFEQIVATMVGHGWSAGPPREGIRSVWSFTPRRSWRSSAEPVEPAHGQRPRCAGNAAT